MKLWRLVLACALAFTTMPPVRAAVPWMINYQGRLTDASGTAITGTNIFTFRLYNAATSGTKVWEEDQTVTISSADNGIFNVVLGSVTVLTAVDFNTPLWLAVKVGSDSEMTPRQRITATGYALNADQLDGLDSSKFLRTDIDTSTSGKVTITRAGAALVLTPSSAPAANTKMLDVQNTAGTTKFSVDYEGDVTVAGDLAVSGTVSGTVATSGTTNTTWTVDNDNTSGTEPASGAGVVIEGGSGDASILWDATNDELDVNRTMNLASALTVGTDTTVTSGMRIGTGSTPDNFTALADDSLFVEGNVEVDGTIYAAAVNVGSTAVGDINAVGDITSGAAFTATSGADGTTLYFEGSTSDGNEIALTSANPGSDLTVTIPATAGTLITTGDTGTVTTTMILDSTVTTDDIAADTIAAADIATDGVGAAEIAADAVGTSEIATDGVGSAEIAAGAVGTSEIATDGVDAAEIAADAVGSSELASTTVTAGSYGSATAVGTFTVDADGRLTAASNTTISLSSSNITDDSLDFAQFEDTLDLDAALTLNQTTSTWSQSFTGTTTTGSTYTATDLTSGTALDVNATNTHTADAAIQQVRFDLINAQATAANADFAGLNVNFTNNPSVAGNTEVAMRIQHPVTANTTDNAVSALLLLENVDTAVSGATKITDALRVQATTDTYITDGLDVSDAEIDNAINIGANPIVTGNVAGTIGDATTDAWTFTTDGTGTGEIVLPDESISTAEITNDTITAGDLNATLTFADGDFLNLSSINTSGTGEGLLLPQTTSCASGTAEGQLCWDTDNDTLYVGSGAAATAISSGGSFGATIDDTELTAEDFGSFTCSGSEDGCVIDSGAIGTSEIATDGVGAAEIAADAVGTSEIATDGVAAAEIAADAVGASELAATTVTAGSYTFTALTVDADGRLTAASSGTDDDTPDDDSEVPNNITIASSAVDQSFTFGAGNELTLDAATTDATGTAGVIDLDLDTTSSQAGLDLNVETITDAAVDTVSGIKLTGTQTSTDDDVLYGLNIANLAGTADAGAEYAVVIGSGWDRALSAAGTGVFTLGASDYLQLDGSTTANTTTAGLLDLNDSSSTTSHRALDLNTAFTATGAATSYSLVNAWSSSAVVAGAGVSQTAYGDYTTATKTGADTATGTYSLYGTYASAANTGSTAAGTKNTYGGSFTATGDAAGTSTTYALYADASGADTNYALYVNQGRVATADGVLLDLSAVNTSGTSEGLLLPQAADCSSGTAEGQICWDTDNVLYVGTGTAATAISSGGSFGATIDDTELTAEDFGSFTCSGSEDGCTVDADAVGTAEIATNGVGAAEIAADAVGTSEIATDGVGAAEIAADAVGTSEIATDGVDAAEIVAGAVGASELAATTVTAGSYTFTALTVDADGRLTAASSGTDDDTPDDDSEVPNNLTIASSAVDQSFTFGAGNELTLDAAATDATGTAGVIDLDLDTTSSQAGLDLNVETITDSAADTVSGIKLTGTQTSTDDDVLYGLNIANLAGTADAGAEYAVVIGSGWDRAISASGPVVIAAGADPGTGLDVSASVTTSAATNYAIKGSMEHTGATVNNADEYGVYGEAKASNTVAGLLGIPGLAGVYGLGTSNTPTGVSLGLAYGVLGKAQNINAGTLANAVALRAGAVVNSGGGAITAASGVRIDNQGASGVTTAYGLYLDNQTGATTNYALYQTGTGGTNVLNANTRIGSTTAPSNALDVTGTFTADTYTAADGDLIDFDAVNVSSTSEGILLPQTTSCASGTAEGQLCWDTDNDTLYVGSGAAATAISSGGSFGATIDDTEMTNEDFGSFTCSGSEDGCTVDANAVGASEIATGGVATAEILDGTIAAADIAAGTITTAEIAADTITGADVADDTFDFVDFEDTLDLDAALTINSDSGETITESFTISVETAQAGSFNIDMTNGINTTGAYTQTALDIDVTNANHTGGGIVLYGVDLQLTDNDAASTSNTFGLNIGGTWDVGLAVASNVIRFNDVDLGDDSASANAISLASGDSLTVINGAICVDNDGTCTSLTAGQVRADSFPTTGGDVAEMYVSHEPLQPGDVVMIDAEHPDAVAKAATSYHPALIGVVSTDPGLILRSGELYDEQTRTMRSNVYPIGLSGRVPVKVSTANGPIAAGDRLTSSDMPGVAIKATEPGPTIGIALEAFDGKPSEVGKILCFVSIGERNLRATVLSLQAEVQDLRARLEDR